MDAKFLLEAQRPVVEHGERCDYFAESKIAHAHYLGHRSTEAAANTTTYHIVRETGEVAGFISFRVVSEEFDDLIVIHFSVEYVYILQRFRMHGLGGQLLEPLVQEVQAALHQATSAGSRKNIRLQSASSPESLGGSRLLKDLETRVLVLASTCSGVTLVGRYINRPVSVPSARGYSPERSDAREVAY